MKHFLIIIFTFLGLNLLAQSEKYAGNYENKTVSDDGIIIEYKLSLNSDGTFKFHFFQDQICYSDNDKAQGKWKVKNGIIVFNSTKKTDINEIYKLNFDKTKATVTNNVLRFYDSGIFWINKTELKKKYFQNNSNYLVGKWKCYYKELEDGTTKSTDLFSGKEFEYSCDGLIIELKSDFTGSESIVGLNFKYQRNDSILNLGNRNYIIEKLSKTELILRDYDSEGTNISNYRQKFKRKE